MAPIVVPGVCRFSIEALYAANECVNTFLMRIDTTGGPTSREDAIVDQAQVFVNEWSDHILPLVSSRYTAQNVSWVDLNSLDGSTGSVTEGADEVWPQNGSLTTAPVPGNVAALIAKVSNNGRAFRNGRLYLAGLSEGDTGATEPNTLSSAKVAALNAGFADFLAGINQTGGILGYESDLVNCHFVGGVFQEFTIVNAFQTSQTVATQRRRVRD